MKKSIKLLSVLLTVLMIFSSVSIGAFAAKTSYQTVANLESLHAYSPYGTVTRLDTEARLSIVMDSLDQLLLKANIKTNVPVIGDIDLTSINGLFATVDNIVGILDTFLIGAIAKAALGKVGDLNWDAWQTNVRRESHTQMQVLNTLLTFLCDAKTKPLLDDVIKNGNLDLGLLSGVVPIDLSIIKDIPKLVKGLIFPLLSRPDNNSSERQVYIDKTATIESVLQSFVDGLFSRPMSWTSYRVDANGNTLKDANGKNIEYTLPLPTSSESTRYFVAGTNADGVKIMEQWDYNFDREEHVKTVTYTLEKEFKDDATSNTYIYRAPEGYNGDSTLKWYKNENVVDANGNIQSGYWLPSVASDYNAGKLSLGINNSDTFVGLLYKFIPYVFAEMAPTVLNGSVKKLLAELFDVEFVKIGLQDEQAVKDVATATGNPDNFFTKDQEYYTWEYSDYKVINGTPYYRYQDQYFVGNIPSNISTYYYMFDWDWKVSDDFMNKYIPGAEGSTTTYNTILKSLNNFIGDVIDLALVDSFDFKGQTYTPVATIGWEKGDNTKIIDNVIKAARSLFGIAPTEFFDEFYNDPELSPYYDMMMNGTKQQALTGLLAAVAEMLMPQIILPTADKLQDAPFIAIGVLIVRELCTQLMPTYNFDAMIFTDYTSKTLVNKTADQWLDTVLYMGVNLGMFYLRNIADIGEDDATNGYYGAMNKLGALPTTNADAMEFAAGAAYIGSTPTWQYLVDWVIDWALSNEVLWAWHFDKLITVTGTVKLSTYEDPWKKLDSVLLSLLPLDKVLNTGDATAASGTFTEKILRGQLIRALFEMDADRLVSLLDVTAVNDCILTKDHILNQVLLIVRNLLNNVLKKVAGGTLVIPENVTTIEGDTGILNNNNLATVVWNIVGNLKTAISNGLLDPVLPIVNFFVGWTTDPQKYAEPSIILVTAKGDNYLNKVYPDGNKLLITNSSSGMLLKHRNSDVTDHGYDITIQSVTAEGAGLTVEQKQAEVVPGNKAEYALNLGSLTDGVAKITIKYQFKGKDYNVNSAALGGVQTKVFYVYCSTIDDQENVWHDDFDTGDYSTSKGYNEFTFTESLYDTVLNYVATVEFKDGTFLGAVTTNKNNETKRFDSITAPDNGKDMDARANQYFDYITERTDTTWSDKIQSPDRLPDGIHSSSGKLFKAAAGITSKSFSEKNSEDNGLYGYYDMGRFAIKYGKNSAYWEPDFVYYNDYNIGDVMNSYFDKNLFAEDFADNAAAFTTYENALKNVVKYAEFPKRTDYTTTVQPYIKDAIKALDDAYAALIAVATPKAKASVDEIQTMLDQYETDKSKDIDFENYKLFEYFQYEKQRTNARNMIKATKAPVAPTKYIEGEGLSAAAIDEILKAEKNENAKKGIDATYLDPNPDAVNAYNDAKANFRPRQYSELEIKDQTAKIAYYGNFLTTNVRDKSLPYQDFLKKEIEVAETVYPINAENEAKYSADSWNAYIEAYNTAKAVPSNADYSEVFDAKYSLMKAERDLLPKYASMKESGYLDRELNVVVEQANNILDYYGTSDSYYTLADGVTEADALAQLVKALGRNYKVKAEGVDYEGILYARSAITFQAYDRIASVKNMKAVDNAAEKLRAALKNFVIDVAVVPNTTSEVKQVNQDVRFIQGITPGSITNINDLLAQVHSTKTDAVLEGATNKDGMFGTGATVTVYLPDADKTPIAKYFVVIYGDVNGDGAIDGIDTFEVDKHMHRLTTLLNVYETAADTDGDGEIEQPDYSAIKQAAAGFDTVSQTIA